MAKTPGATALTDEEVIAIIERIADGVTLKQSCQKSKRAYAAVKKYIDASKELKALYAQAREEYVRSRVQEMHDIAKDKSIDPARARIMIDVIKWEAARVIPKEFGDRVQQEVIINDNRTLSTRMSQARARARQQTEAIATQLPPKGQEDEHE